MIFGEKEADIIKNMQLMYTEGEQQIALFPSPNFELESVLNKVCYQTEWTRWIDSSGKSAPPPDFYSDEYKLMIDVMRVNDHEKKGNKGKLHNPSMVREREIYRELEDAGVIEQFPNAKVYITGNTKLPTYEDHNYDLYLKCFSRVVSKHVDSIPLYHKNHPGYKTIFIVFDESSAYFEADVCIDPNKQLKKGDRMSGRPHLFFCDKAFLDVFVNKGIDYFFWYTPYKRLESINLPIELPSLCVYDLSKECQQIIEYDVTKMTSVEI